MENKEIAKIFWQIAEILELKNENPFRIRAYQKAAQTIENFSENLEIFSKKQNLQELPGIGKDLAEKIKEIIQTGKLKFLDQIKKGIPEGLLEIMTIPGMGPKHTMLLYQTLGIKTISQLKKAAESGKIKNIPGLGEKTEQNILQAIKQKEKFKERFTLDLAYFTAQVLIEELSKNTPVDKIVPAGSLRRMKETIGDLDILVTSKKPSQVIKKFTSLKDIQKIIAEGPTKASILLENGIQVDLRVVANESFGSALHYFTGSKNHNIKIRQFAQKKGLKINEYGIFRIKDNKKIGGETEEEIFEILGLDFIPPEMREDTGEFELALNHKIPHLIEISDIKGDLHLHSSASDGASTIEELVKKAKSLGYQYIAITDHSISAGYAGGLKIPRLLQQIDFIKNLNRTLKNFRVLTGAEVDIKPDGSLDYPDEVLKKLDFVNASIHSAFKMPREQMTKRIIKAMENPYVTAFCHPTGRLIGIREPYEVDIEAIIENAQRTQTILEINAHPRRLDLTDRACYLAKEKKAPMMIATDSHLLEQLEYMFFGVAVARRGFLEAKDVINTFSLEKLLKFIKIKREDKI